MSGTSPNEVQAYINQKFGSQSPLSQMNSQVPPTPTSPVITSSTGVPIIQGETFLKPYETTAAKQAMAETSGGKGAGQPTAAANAPNRTFDRFEHGGF